MTAGGPSPSVEPPDGAARGATPSELPERPPLSAPPQPAPRPAAGGEPPPAVRSQPLLGLVGLVLVVPIGTVLALGAGGAERSVVILGPIVTYSLPLVAMVAFWWEDWPGTGLRPSWSGWANTALLVAGAVALTAVGQAVAGGFDPGGMFDPSPGPGHVPTFPVTVPLAAAAFTAMLQVTLVGEGWPLRVLPRIPAGLAALGAAWAVALVVYFALVEVRPPPGSDASPRDGPVPADDFGAVLVLVGAAQVLVYVVWRGRPFSAIVSRPVRLTCAHVAVLGAGIVTFLAVHVVVGVGTHRLVAVAGCFIAAGLLLGLQLDGWPRPHPGADPARLATLLAALALTGVLATGLHALARGMDVPSATADDWVAHASLNALGGAVILHVAIGRRWPFASPA